MDAAAPGQARELYQRAGVTFVRGIDGADMLFETLDFEVVPNGFFVDENGIVRYAKFGGFEVRDDTDRAAIEGLLAKPSSPVSAKKTLSTKAAVPSGPAAHAGPLLRWAAFNFGPAQDATDRRRAPLDPRAFRLDGPVVGHLVGGGAGEEAAVGLAGPDGHGAVRVAPDEVVAMVAVEVADAVEMPARRQR